MPLVNYAPVPGAMVPVGPPLEMEEAHADFIAGELNRIASAARVPPRARHLHMGVVSSELYATAKSIRAGIVVMGAVSRSALRRVFVGSTAETVLDKLTCDVLVLKPTGFQSSVDAREYAEVAGTIESDKAT